MDKNNNVREIIYINNMLSTPIYKQIIHSIQRGISAGVLENGDLIPSVNAIAAEYSIARGSIFKAYNELKSSGVIDSVPGKGYFITNTKSVGKKNIFLLMSTFNPYREVFFNAFVSKIKNHATVDMYFHHHNIKVFETLIQNHASHYNTFVIMPAMFKQTGKILQQLDQRNLYILDRGFNEFGSKYPSVCQNYAKDIILYLKSIEDRLEKYKRVVLLFSSNMRTFDIITGFEKFFEQHPKQGIVIRETEEFEPKEGDLCIALDDSDLVHLILTAKENNWVLGQHLGIISYNEIPMKSIVAEGITTISPDFEQMAASMADLILNNKKDNIENPYIIIERNSF